jgi:hypothetical protein
MEKRKAHKITILINTTALTSYPLRGVDCSIKINGKRKAKTQFN